MLVLDVVARSFPRDYPTVLPEPGRDIPDLIRVLRPAHDCPSLWMCIEYTQQADRINDTMCISVYMFSSQNIRTPRRYPRRPL